MMRRIGKHLRRQMIFFIRDERGISAVEYGILLMISAIMLVALFPLGDTLAGVFTEAAQGLAAMIH